MGIPAVNIVDIESIVDVVSFKREVVTSVVVDVGVNVEGSTEGLVSVPDTESLKRNVIEGY